MGKPKKKDKKKEFVSDDEEPPRVLAPIDSDEAEEQAIVNATSLAKKPAKKKQKGKSVPKQSDITNGVGCGDSADEDDDFPIAGKAGRKPTGFAALMMDDSDVSDDQEDGGSPVPRRQTGGFASLLADSDDDEELGNAADRHSDDEQAIKSGAKKKDKKKGKDKKKKKKHAILLDEEDDLEKMLSELSVQPAEEVAEVQSDSAPRQIDLVVEANVEEVDKKVVEEGNVHDVADASVKTKAQIRKEKKERLKMEKLSEPAEKSKEETKTVEEPTTEDTQAEKESKKSKKKKKADPVVTQEKDDKKKGPSKKIVAAMQEALRQQQAVQERMQREEEERIRREEAEALARQEQAARELELKEQKRKQAKERRDQLKAEGKLLTPKQRQNAARAQAMLESLKLQGVQVGQTAGAQKPRQLSARDARKQRKKQQQSSAETLVAEESVVTKPVLTLEKSDKATVRNDDISEAIENSVTDSWHDSVKESWDQDSDEADDEVNGGSKITAGTTATAKTEDKKLKANGKILVSGNDREASSSSSASEDEAEATSSEGSSSSDNDDEEDDDRTEAQRKRDRVLQRIKRRQEEARRRMTPECLRAPVICVLGHVDTGKTKILDKLRRTNVQEGEAGGITQQIGATNVPLRVIEEQQRHVKQHKAERLRIPGLLIIDTPGHESFSNLRSRGSSLCDLAILVVDIMHGLEPQTIESINLLKAKRTPFVVALNKIDRLYDWETGRGRDVQDVIAAQERHTCMEFEQRWQHVMTQLAEQGLNARLFYDNPNVREYLSVVPTSAITGEGMANLMSLVVMLTQNLLTKRLMYSDELQATVLEVKQIAGLGTTIDVILINGTLREGSTVVVAGTDGPIVTQIRSLLMPQPLKELRVKNAYKEFAEVRAAQGVKIAARDLEKAIAGLNLLVAESPDEVDVCRALVNNELRSALRSIRLSERGVHVQASTLGSLEALLEFLRTSKIAYSGVRIGPVVKRDVMKASAQLQHSAEFACILAFDVKVERDAQELADQLSVTIFQADIIYHLFDKFTAFKERLRQQRRDQHRHIAVFPCRLRVLPQFVFNSRDPIVVGVTVEGGIVHVGTPLAVPSRDFIHIGHVSSIENNHKQVDSARQGADVCIKIEAIAGESPKMFGRHFDEKDILTSLITRESIDACKNYFREDLIKADWQLMIELKKLFKII